MEQAIEAFRAALQLDSRCAPAHHGIAVAQWQLGRADDALTACRQALAIQPDYPYALNMIGVILASRGEHGSAIDSLRRAVAAQPDYATAWHNLANSLEMVGRAEEALRAYGEALRINPRLVEAEFELAAAGQRPAPAAAPAAYVRRLFDGYAARFNQHLSQLQYQVPALLWESVQSCGALPENCGILDLGCGTGLSGQPFRQSASRLVGVDLSPAMLEQARRLNIYDELVCDELISYLQHTSYRFDVMVAADVLIYFGDLGPVFGAVRAHSIQAAFLLFRLKRQNTVLFGWKNSNAIAIQLLILTTSSLCTL